MPKIHQNVHNFHSLSYIIWIWKLFNSFDRSCEKLKSMWVHGMVFRISPLENWGQNVKITTGLALCQNNDDWKPPMKHNMYVSFDRSTTYSATIVEHWSCISYGGLCGVFFFHFDNTQVNTFQNASFVCHFINKFERKFYMTVLLSK